MTTTSFLQSLQDLQEGGLTGYATAGWKFYDQMTAGKPLVERVKVSDFCDDVLANYLESTDPVTTEEVLMSPDFAFLKSYARVLQDLNPVIVLNESDLEAA